MTWAARQRPAVTAREPLLNAQRACELTFNVDLSPIMVAWWKRKGLSVSRAGRRAGVTSSRVAISSVFLHEPSQVFPIILD